MEELLPVIALGIGALLFSQKSSAAPVNPYASIPSGAVSMGSMGTPLMSNAVLYSAQPIPQYGGQAQPYFNQGYVGGMSNPYGNPQSQTANGLINLASGVINKLPNNLLASNQNPSTVDKAIGVAKNQATNAAADAALNTVADDAAMAASDAAAQAAVEQAAAADAANAAAATATDIGGSVADAAASSAADSSLWDSVVSFAGDTWEFW